ncbi:MAG TPA: DNA-3-methyladenine glycosylase I [Alphaproteobacteria bacterium]|nr:DNA-3-methyladenine glycosylase I [Alphaproteobacteria bacterium]
MTPFRTILAAAEKRTGGKAELAKLLPKPKTANELSALSDDRCLSMISLRVFRAGLKHSLVDAKWPAFEAVFHGFVPRRVRAMSDEALERLMGDRRLIRHWGKLKSVRDNAAAMIAVSNEHGSMGRYLADWPADNIIQLWDDLAKRFSQMGGNSAAYFLRMVGKDTFILTPYVARALIEWGAMRGGPKGKKEREMAAAAILAWAKEAKRPLCQVSMILARSVA